jgi:hypothetical protein
MPQDPPKCQKSDFQKGLDIKTSTGTDDNNVVCKIGGREDIKHFVWVENLRGYKTFVECSGEITPDQGSIFFKSDNSRVTEKKWEEDCSLDRYGEYPFSPVGLFSKRPNSGSQTIEVNFKIDRLRERGDIQSASLQITVFS